MKNCVDIIGWNSLRFTAPSKLKDLLRCYLVVTIRYDARIIIIMIYIIVNKSNNHIIYNIKT